MHIIRIIGVAAFVLALLLGSADFARAKNGDPNPESYNGEITAVDTQAKTIIVKGDDNATRIFSIGPETKIEKETQRLGLQVHSILPGSFDELSVGKHVRVLTTSGTAPALRVKTIVISSGH